TVTGVQTCALPIWVEDLHQREPMGRRSRWWRSSTRRSSIPSGEKGAAMSTAQRDQAGRFVEAPRPERLQIDGDELEPRRLECGDGLRAHAQEPVEVRLAGLDARDLAVLADAELAQTERAHLQLALGQLREPFGRHLRAVGDARRETGLLRPVPGGQ